jgi:GAF domain-containing protein
MSNEFVSREYPDDKEELYALVHHQLEALVSGERCPMPNLANASALLWLALRDINWAGFYLMMDGELVLGPFQGKPACIRIKVGTGVCGTAVQQDRVQLVKDVHQFPGHIACDSASNSEIVVPIHSQGEVVGVLDVDSPSFARFDDVDRRGLEKVVEILERACDFS